MRDLFDAQPDGWSHIDLLTPCSGSGKHYCNDPKKKEECHVTVVVHMGPLAW